MELAKVTNSSLIEYRTFFRLSSYFTTLKRFLLLTAFFHSLWHLWLLSHILFLAPSLFPTCLFPSLFLWLLAMSVLPEPSHPASGLSQHLCSGPFRTHLSCPYHCLNSRSTWSTTCWSIFWVFHSYLNFFLFQNWTHSFTFFCCIFYLSAISSAF